MFTHRSTSNVKAHISSAIKSHLRGAFYVLLLIFVWAIPFTLAQQHVIKPTGVLRAHPVLIPPPPSPQEVIYDRYNNAETPTPTSTATATPTATHTPTPCGQYWTTSGTLPIVPGTTDTGNHCDNCDTAVILPFPFRLYGVSYTSVMVSSNGRLDFLCNNEPFVGGVCLPVGAYNCPFDYTIFPYWTNFLTVSGLQGCQAWTNGCGIFTSVSGIRPNRIFNIEWHTVPFYPANTPYDFEVRLYENDPDQRFDVIYGAITDDNHITQFWVGGVQGPPGFFTEDFCETGMSPPRTNVSRTYTFVPCASPTPTSTPTATPPASPTPTPTPTPCNGRCAPTPRPRPRPPPRP